MAVSDGILAAAIESDPATDPGSVVFFDRDGNVLNQFTVGALPDQLIFTPDGTKVLERTSGIIVYDITVLISLSFMV